MSSDRGTTLRDAFRPEIFPVFLMYFLWGFGTGGLWFVRPLFAWETGGTFLLVGVISSVSAMPRIVTGPVTGYLTDRFGRLPFVVLGSVLHVIAMTSDYFVTTFVPFLLLEIVGGIGISVWMTSSSILMADSTRVESRGRVFAVREMSSRVGLLIGPVVAGGIAQLFEVKAVFLFIAATKVAVIIVTVLWIKETRKADDAAPRSLKLTPSIPDLSMFRTRAFLALAVATVAVSMVGGGTGAFRTLFPAQTASVGLNEAEIGLLLSVAGALALIASFPSGMIADAYGRRRLLIGGLLVTGLAALLMANVVSFTGAAVAVFAFGVSEAAGWGTTQVYAADLAPQDRRGAFLGVWGMVQNLGQVTGPLIIGVLAEWLGFGIGFGFIALLVAIGAVMVFFFGRETTKITPGQSDRSS